MGTGQTRVLKRIRKGAYECQGFLVIYAPWTNEKWDGPRENFLGWQVYRAGSAIERRVLIDAFASRRAAYDYIKRQMDSKN